MSPLLSSGAQSVQKKLSLTGFSVASLRRPGDRSLAVPPASSLAITTISGITLVAGAGITSLPGNSGDRARRAEFLDGERPRREIVQVGQVGAVGRRQHAGAMPGDQRLLARE